jgi:formate/nitrite transporter FocA (FNT family)
MENQRVEKDLESIRHLMERSVKFISLSGLAGILAGVYALIGAALAYYQIYSGEVTHTVEYYQGNIPIVYSLILIAIVVLAASLVTGWWYSFRKAKKLKTKIWSETSKRLLMNLAIPLVVGGVFTLVLVYHGYYNVVASSVLIFYGLALINASSNLYEEIRYLGYCELVVGLIAAALPGYGLYFWAVGFGMLHILYGGMMYKKYDR